MTRRTAVVTGAGSGMGRLVASRLAREGWQVAAIDRDLAGVREIDPGERIFAYENDVTDEEAVGVTVERIHADLGPVHRLVCAAGIGVGGPNLEVPPSRFRQVIEVNYLGVVHWVHHVAPEMVDRRSGEIVIFASLAGWVPAPGMGAYCASKFAVVGYSEVLHRELAEKGVNVLAVCPPSVDTPMLGVLVDEGAVPERAIRIVKPISPQRVVDAIEPALRRGRPWVFPGRGSPTIQRARRFAPNLTAYAVKRIYGL